MRPGSQRRSAAFTTTAAAIPKGDARARAQLELSIIESQLRLRGLLEG